MIRATDPEKMTRKSDQINKKRRENKYVERGGEAWRKYNEKIGLAPISIIPGKPHQGLMSFSLGVKVKNAKARKLRLKSKGKIVKGTDEYYNNGEDQSCLRGYILGI